MRKFRNLSIRVKLLVIILSIVLVALLLATSAIGYLNYRATSQDFSDQLTALFDVTAERSIAALAFRDSRAINNNLNALARLDSVLNACIYDANGKLFGGFNRSEKKTCVDVYSPEQPQFPNTVNVSGEITLNEKALGHLVIIASTKGFMNRVWQFVLYSCLVILVSVLVAYFLSSALQRGITLPIIRLSNIATRIGETRDFSLRAHVYNDDEAGNLADSFNHLIGDIQDYQMQMQELVLELQEKTRQLTSHTEFVEDRNKAIRNMFAGASHDLRQPLQAMALFVNALNEICDDDQRQLLKKLDLAISNMRNLFDDLLDVSKLESRLGNIQRGPVNLKPLLESVFHEFEVLAADKNIELRIHMKDILVDSNASMLERIIRNLLSNAIRYTNKGGVLLATRNRGDTIWVEVWDTGRGIPKEAQQRVFKQFYQVERISKEGQQGFGIGLSIVKRLTELLGHTVEVMSREGRGTLFRIHVPLYHEGARDSVTPLLQNDETTLAGTQIRKVTHLPGAAARILLIDDDELIRDGLVALMKGWGMEVTDFPSISSMREFLIENSGVEFDLIVSDFQLSETETGIDAIREANQRLNSDDRKPDIPALIVTGAIDAEIHQAIKEAGLKKLNKPVMAAKLRALINHLLKTD